MVCGCEREIRPPNFAPCHSQAFERLRRGDFVNKVAVDVKNHGLARFMMDGVSAPDFVE